MKTCLHHLYYFTLSLLAVGLKRSRSISRPVDKNRTAADQTRETQRPRCYCKTTASLAMNHSTTKACSCTRVIEQMMQVFWKMHGLATDFMVTDVT